MGMMFCLLLDLSFCCLYVALRARSWPFALAAFLIVAPISQLSFAWCFYLTWWACLLMALTVGLCWSVTRSGWLGLCSAATAICFIALIGPYNLHWHRSIFWVLPLGVLVGLFSLAVPRAPWVQPHMTFGLRRRQ